MHALARITTTDECQSQYSNRVMCMHAWLDHEKYGKDMDTQYAVAAPFLCYLVQNADQLYYKCVAHFRIGHSLSHSLWTENCKTNYPNLV